MFALTKLVKKHPNELMSLDKTIMMRLFIELCKGTGHSGFFAWVS